MKETEHLLVVIKPDAMSKGLYGEVLARFAQAKLDIVAIKLLTVSRDLAEEHYRHIKGKPFYQMTLDHILGNGYKDKRVLAIVYRGDNAVKVCRDLVGATNPKDADKASIRGTYGRVTDKGVFENVVHASSDKKEAEREIKLWFQPDEIPVTVFPSKEAVINSVRKKVWA